MSDRLILKPKPLRHRYGLALGVLAVMVGVAGVWGWQIKTTFEHYSSERAEQPMANGSLADLRERLSPGSPIDALEAVVDAQTATTDAATEAQSGDVVGAEEAIDSESLKTDVIEQLRADLQVEITGEVAGDSLEVN